MSVSMRHCKKARTIIDEGLESENLDPRHPLYLGTWERSIPLVHEGIARDDMDEPHLKRKHEILNRYPEVTKLFGPEPSTKYILAACVLFQLTMAYFVGKSESVALLLVSGYFISGTVTGLFGVLIHEACHNLFSSVPFHNRIYGLMCNICIVVPIAASFRRHHLDHHTFQGITTKDPDLPLEFEHKLIKNNVLLKVLWISVFPFLYMFRGLAMRKAPQKWEIINFFFTAVTDILIFRFCGWFGFLYLFLGLWFGYSLHPAAAHFIQEHYTFTDGQETYSYYGPLNWFFLNIGLHNEHHDFTKISWRNLQKLHDLAPEFYKSLHYHKSWVKVLVDFILDPKIGPQSRVGREMSDHVNGRSTISKQREKIKLT